MKKTTIILAVITVALAGAGLAVHQGLIPLDSLHAKAPVAQPAETAQEPAPLAVTVAKVTEATLVETAVVTGTLVPRDEILVSPEVEGMRVLELVADVGDRVEKGQKLAVLERATLNEQLAQIDASLARADASIAQAKSQIAQAEAAATEAKAALDRALPLNKSGYVSDAVRDQREAASRTSAAQLVAARDGLKVAEASKVELQAQKRTAEWRLSKTEIRAPRAGVISRRNARVGGLASAVAEPLFRIVADGLIELDGEATETALARIKPGQPAIVEVAGVGNVEGKVRLVSPEIDRATRLGSVRILLGDQPGLRTGAFGRGRIETASSRGLAVPASALLYVDDRAEVLVVIDGRVAKREVKTGLRADQLVEIKSGVAAGDLVVATAGTFLRDGDAVRAILPDARVSDAERARSNSGAAAR